MQGDKIQVPLGPIPPIGLYDDVPLALVDREQLKNLPAPPRDLALGPAVTGALSDALEPRFGDDSLRYALLIVSMMLAWAGFHFYRAGRTTVFLGPELIMNTGSSPSSPSIMNTVQNTDRTLQNTFQNYIFS